jgi:hypothetical protein
MLTSADLGDVTQFGDGYRSDLGLFGIAPHAIDAGFLGGRTREWLVTMALTGPYRADDDAYARSIDYPIQELPYLPLTGLIVTEHPGLPLEVFEQILVFRDDSWASRWIEMSRSNVAQQGTSTENGVIQPRMSLLEESLGDESIAVVQPPPVGIPVPSVGSVMVESRLGRTVISVTVNGGSMLRVGQALVIAKDAWSRVNAACPEE